MTIWKQAFTETSCTTKELEQFLNEKTHGIVLLDGDSGCGKTMLLKKLKSDSKRPVHIVSYESFFQEHFFQNLITKSESPLKSTLIPNGCTYAIEDIDFLRGRFHTQLHLGLLLNGSSASSLIILTGIRIKSRVPDLYSALSSPMLFEAKSEKA